MPSTDPEFFQALHPGRATYADGLLPEAALLKNESSRNIMAWSVRWTLTDQAGKAITQDSTMWNFATLRPEDGIPARGSRIVSVLTGLGTAFLASSEPAQERVRHLLDLYQQQAKITISVEAILFDDGAAVGPDSAKWISRFRAYLNAERDVAERALSTSVRTSLRQTLAIVSREGMVQISDENRRTLAGLTMEFNRASNYDQAYALMRAYFAAQLIDAMDSQGDGAALLTLRAYHAKRTYPVVHREEK